MPGHRSTNKTKWIYCNSFHYKAYHSSKYLFSPDREKSLGGSLLVEYTLQNIMGTINHRPTVTVQHQSGDILWVSAVWASTLQRIMPSKARVCVSVRGPYEGGANRPGVPLHNAATDKTRWTDHNTFLFLINPTGPMWFTLTFIYKSCLIKTASSCPNSPTHHCRYQRQPLALAPPPSSCLRHVWPTSVCTTL